MAHRTHLYQYLANEAGGNRLVIATCYGALQIGVGALTLAATRHPQKTQIGVAFCVLVIFIILHIGIRRYILAGQLKTPQRLD